MAFLWTVLYIAGIGILANLIGESVPRTWFHWDKFPYRTHAWEKGGKIYEKIGVDRWKDHAPDMSRVMKNMVPKRFETFPTVQSVYTLIKETCVAEITHFILCLCGPVIYLFWFNGWGILIAVLYILFNIPFMIIQRYNRPALLALAKRLEVREERRKHANPDPVGEHR